MLRIVWFVSIAIHCREKKKRRRLFHYVAIIMQSCALVPLSCSIFPHSPLSPTNCLPIASQLPFPATQPFFACLQLSFPSSVPSSNHQLRQVARVPLVQSHVSYMTDSCSVRTDHVRRERETSPKPQKCMKQVPSSWPLLLRS